MAEVSQHIIKLDHFFGIILRLNGTVKKFFLFKKRKSFEKFQKKKWSAVFSQQSKKYSNEMRIN